MFVAIIIWHLLSPTLEHTPRNAHKPQVLALTHFVLEFKISLIIYI